MLGTLNQTQIEDRIRANWLNLFDAQLYLRRMNPTTMCKAAGIGYSSYQRIDMRGAPVGLELMIVLARYANIPSLGYFTQVPDPERSPLPYTKGDRKRGPRPTQRKGEGHGWKAAGGL